MVRNKTIGNFIDELKSVLKEISKKVERTNQSAHVMKLKDGKI